MKRFLSEQERTHMDRRVSEAEKRTGAQIVLAVVERSDVYAELPWKAFALGAGAGGLAAALQLLLRGSWTSSADLLLAVGSTLVPGAAAALLCVLVPGVARLLLDRARAEVETRQYAESLFLARELFATSGRTGILLLVSLFERRVVLLPDRGLSGRLGPDAVRAVIDVVTAALGSGSITAAFESGLGELERRLGAAAPAGSGGNELPNAIVEEGLP